MGEVGDSEILEVAVGRRANELPPAGVGLVKDRRRWGGRLVKEPRLPQRPANLLPDCLLYLGGDTHPAPVFQADAHGAAQPGLDDPRGESVAGVELTWRDRNAQPGQHAEAPAAARHLHAVHVVCQLVGLQDVRRHQGHHDIVDVGDGGQTSIERYAARQQEPVGVQPSNFLGPELHNIAKRAALIFRQVNRRPPDTVGPVLVEEPRGLPGDLPQGHIPRAPERVDPLQRTVHTQEVGAEIRVGVLDVQLQMVIRGPGHQPARVAEASNDSFQPLTHGALVVLVRRRDGVLPLELGPQADDDGEVGVIALLDQGPHSGQLEGSVERQINEHGVAAEVRGGRRSSRALEAVHENERADLRRPIRKHTGGHRKQQETRHQGSWPGEQAQEHG